MFKPDLKALLLVDMQTSALPDRPWAVHGMNEVVSAANHAISACRKAGIPIIFTQHRVLESFKGLGSSSNSTPDSVREGGFDLNAIIPDLNYKSDEDQLMVKQRWSAFAYTDLDLRLSVLPGTELAIAGTVTDGCVQETAYDAFYRQLRVILIEDAIGACTDGEHKAAMLSMANWLYESRITSSENFATWLDGGPYMGWAWRQAHEFPYTTASLEADFNRLMTYAHGTLVAAS